jgi:S1-C subfamily serine protease
MCFDLVRQNTVAIRTLDDRIVGTGFIVSEEGHLLTCAHVIGDAGGSERVQVNGTFVNQICLGDRDRDDFAVLQVENTPWRRMPLSLAFERGGQFQSIGYGPLGFPEGATTDGRIIDKNPRNCSGGGTINR